MTKKIRLIELFAGYGSQALALRYLNIPFEHYFVCEIDDSAILSYNELHGTNFVTSDIRHIHATDLGIVDSNSYNYLLTYSFPCTDLSTAGKMGGMVKGSGTASSLLWEVERILSECKELPQYLLMENVPQVINKNNINIFSKWTQFLNKLGYINSYKVLNAKDFGIPQNRKRCFMISILHSENRDFCFPTPTKLNTTVLDFIDTCYMWNDPAGKWILSEKGKRCLNMSFASIAPPTTICNTITYRGYISWNTNYYNNGVNIRRYTGRENLRLMGLKDDDIDKLTQSEEILSSQAGNSIVVNVLMAIFENLFIRKCKCNKLF